jgi:thioredoxin 1
MENGMKSVKSFKNLIIAVSAALVFFLVFFVITEKRNGGGKSSTSITPPTQAADLPRLLELSSPSCLACRQMEPVLRLLQSEYAGQLDVQFIDVEKYGSRVQKYNIRVIPTLIFFDRRGKEIFRHEGFVSEKRIVAKFRELGIVLNKELKDDHENGNK